MKRRTMVYHYPRFMKVMNWFESLALSSILVAALFICQYEADNISHLASTLKQPAASPLSALLISVR